MLKLWPSAPSSSVVDARTAGTQITAMSVIFQLRRNRSSTPAASNAPINTASRTLPALSTMSWLWSYQLATWTPLGRRGA